MEAAQQLGFHPLRERHRRRLEAELQELRGLGEIFLMRRFDGSISGPDAEDAVADVIIRLQRKIEAGAEIRNLRAVFFTSVRNAAIDQLRSRAAKPTVEIEAVAEMPAAEPTPDEIAEADEEKVRLRETLARMRPNYREAIVLRFGVGMTVPEISERLGISLPAAKKLVLRATEQARTRLRAIGDQDFCPEIREQAQALLIDGVVAETSERHLLDAHLDHCGSCKSFVAELHRNLNELGSILLAGGAVTGADAHVTLVDRLGGALDSATGAAQAAAAKARLATYKLSGAFGTGDGGASAALAGSAGKALAVCGAATATTACVATGVIGPGLGVGALAPEKTRDEHPAPIERTAEPEPVEVPVVSPTPEAEPEPPPIAEPKEAQPSEQPAQEPVIEESPPTPSQESAEQFGFESSSPPPEPMPAPDPAPAPSGTSASSSGGGGGGGGEQFGFGG